jgi:hypothetical protein
VNTHGIGLRQNGLNLYVKRIFIMNDCKELMPAWLRFVKGVVDSEDLPLNVSREILQKNAVIQKINKSATKKVLQVLEAMAKEDKEKYRAFWKEFGSVMKEGFHMNWENLDELKRLVRFESSKTQEGEYAGLEEYVPRMKDGQKDIYYITGESRQAVDRSPHLEVFKTKDIEVLYLVDSIDEWVVQGLTEFDGKKLICRESLDYGRSRFDHPLSSRFEEMDAVVVFDDVHVPWDNVLLYRDVERCNAAHVRTGAVVGMAHQVVVKNIAKSEFVLGLAALLVDTIGAERFQHVQEKLAELWVTLETMRALKRAAEADAALDEWGVMRPAWNPLDAARNLFPKLYPRMIEILQQLGASGLVAMPTEQDLQGPLADDIRRYYQAARADAFERIPLFRLAWDAAISAFAGRQVLYERFFFGDPVRMAGSLVTAHEAEIRGYADRSRDLVREMRDEALTPEK